MKKTKEFVRKTKENKIIKFLFTSSLVLMITAIIIIGIIGAYLIVADFFYNNNIVQLMN